MEFNNYDQLRNYTSEWLTESESERLWDWLQKGMITNQQIVNITKECNDNKECYKNTTLYTAWQTFLNTHKYY